MKLSLLLPFPGPSLVVLAPELRRRIEALLSPLGLRLEEDGEALLVAGEEESEVLRVSSALSNALSEAAEEGRGKAVAVLENADLSGVEEALAEVRRIREQVARWREAGLPARVSPSWKSWSELEEILLLVEAVPLSEERLSSLLERAWDLFAEALVHALEPPRKSTGR
jgi:hypothetical protein